MSTVETDKLPLLLIEDERAVTDFVRLALEREGYACRTASSALEGIRALEAGEFIGVISDMRMPGGANGADVHAWIVRHRPALRNKMLFITGDTVNEDTLRALSATGAPYIEKPFRVQELMATVKRIFGRAQ